MDAFKYRAWHKIDKVFIDDLAMNQMFIDMNGRLVWWSHKGFDFVDGRDGAENIIEVSRYAGVKDKNDKEIYKGDIVRTLICLGPAGEMEETMAVTYDDLGQISIQLWVYNENKKYWPEVIGNIYENPELL